MNDLKTTKIKAQKKLITIILFIAAVLCFVLRFFVADKDLDTTLMIVGASSIAGTVVGGLFKESVGNKPTLEEIEEKQFGKRNEI